MKKTKKMISLWLTFALFIGIISAMTTSAGAHAEDIIWSGTNGYNNLDLKFFIGTIFGPLTMDVFTIAGSSTYGWNGISSKVKITHITDNNNLSTNAHVKVIRENLPEGMQGTIRHIDKNTGRLTEFGVGADRTNVHSNWIGIQMFLSNSTRVWQEEPTPPYSQEAIAKMRAQKTFLHEIGHLLKLDHPAIVYSGMPAISGHNIVDKYTGAFYPLAVMNGGRADKFDHIPLTVSQHDRSHLKRKWGS